MSIDENGMIWKMEPAAHQKRILAGAIPVLDSDGFAAYFCDVGTRKTAISITTAINMAHRNMVDALIIVCPATLYSGWANELTLHADLPSVPLRWDVLNPKTQKGQREIIQFFGNSFPVFIVNYEAFSRENEYLEKIVKTFTKKRTLIICDESHKVKEFDSARTKAMIKVTNSVGKRIIMTGTEMPSGRPSNLYPQFLCLDKEFWKRTLFIPNYSMFKARFEVPTTIKLPNGRMQEIPKRVKDMKDYERKRFFAGLDEIRRTIDPYTFRAKRHECFDLPKRETMYIDFDLTPAEQKIYGELKTQLTAEVNGNLVAVTNPVTLFMRFRQVARGFIGEVKDEKKIVHEIEKKPSALIALLEHIEGHEENEIIFCAFTHDVEIVAAAVREFGETVTMYGGQSQEKNQAAKMAFERGEARFIVGNMRMLSAGHNFQKYCHLSCVYSVDSDNEAWGQHEGRIERSGQEEEMLFVRLRARKTIDQRMYDILEGNYKVQHGFSNITSKELLEIV